MQPTMLERLVAATLTELRGQPPENVERSVLLREGTFVGYRFRCQELDAVWLAELQAVEFYGSDHALLKTLPCESVERQAAA